MNPSFPLDEGLKRLFTRTQSGDEESAYRFSEGVREEIKVLLGRHLDRLPAADQIKTVHTAVMNELRELNFAETPNIRLIESVIRWKVQDFARELRKSQFAGPMTGATDPEVEAMKDYLRRLSRREREALRLFYIDRQEEAGICREYQLNPESFRAMRALLRACFTQARTIS